jgi:hypothetical protein
VQATATGKSKDRLPESSSANSVAVKGARMVPPIMAAMPPMKNRKTLLLVLAALLAIGVLLMFPPW